MSITSRTLTRNCLRAGLAVFLLTGGALGCGPADPLNPQLPIDALQQAEGTGKDGDQTITAASQIVNRYAVLAAAAKPGDKTITLSTVVGQGVDALMPLAPDDLLLIIQVQGADIDTSNSAAYGAVIDLLSAGRYEFIGVTSVDQASGTISVYSGCGGLKNSYDPSGHVQVIRVPQYKNLTVAAGAGITAPSWNGQTGGIVALQVRDTITVDGSIDVSGLGFRGGLRNPNTMQRTAGIGSYYRASNAMDGGNRGESIAGYVNEYKASGPFGRGAAANGGGGGNRIGAGGGGGAGGGDVSKWSGQGEMLMSVTGGTMAWPLDPGFDSNRTEFPGGGRGGYTYSSAALDPTMIAPGDMTWGDDFRRERGGLGGRPTTNDPTARLFLGGGGGSGDDYLSTSGAGGSGGGLVFIDARTVVGSGKITANGQSGQPATSTGSGAGGGGGGGTVVIAASGSIDNIGIFASGGTGGSQTAMTANAAGPGGGGGGGYVSISQSTTVMPLAAGGTGGTTASTDMVKFPRNGASDGGVGQVIQSALGPYAGAPYCSIADLALTMTVSPQQASEIDPVQVNLAVENLGPGLSGNVEVALDIPTGVKVSSIDAANWSCRQTTKQLICKLATLAIGTAPVVQVTLIPALGETELALTAKVSAPTTDPVLDNNTASVTLSNPTPLWARPAGGGFGCSTHGSSSTTSHGLWVLGISLLAMRLWPRRVRNPGVRLGLWR